MQQTGSMEWIQDTSLVTQNWATVFTPEGSTWISFHLSFTFPATHPSDLATLLPFPETNATRCRVYHWGQERPAQWHNNPLSVLAIVWLAQLAEPSLSPLCEDTLFVVCFHCSSFGDDKIANAIYCTVGFRSSSEILTVLILLTFFKILSAADLIRDTFCNGYILL